MGLATKLQKVRRMIKDNGLKSGGKIIGGYLKNYLSAFSVDEGEILFITGGLGDKAHYRAYGVAEELKTHGFKCAVTVADNFQLKKLTDRFKIFVFHKVSYSKKIAEVIAEIKKQNKEIIFDTDDLDYDPQYLPYMEYFSQISDTEKREYENGIGAEILNDPYVETATTTVSYLADKLREKGKKVFVVSNKISNHELEIAEKIYQARPASSGDEVALGYFSGTPSHDKDFATIIEALTEILEKYQNTKLILAGPLETENALEKFHDRLEILPRVPRDEFYANLAKCDINLSPLESRNPFCEAKSEIRFIAAGALGIPTVAVKNQTFYETITDASDGFLASGTEEWVQKLSRLIELPNLRREMGEQARQKVLRDYTNKNSHSEEYYAYLRNVL